MKNNILYKKGITLFETLISTIIFGIIMILMFQMSSSFFKLFSANESEQAANSNFIKIYKQMHKEFIITDSRYIYTYNRKFDNTYHNIANRWIVFPVPTDDQGHLKGEGNSFNWKRIFIYYLSCTNSSCTECKKYFQKPNEKLKYCPDKNLIRLSYEYIGSNDKNFFALALYTLCNDINSYTLNYDGSFPKAKEYDISGYGKHNIFKYQSKKIIATDILDMIVKTSNKNIKIAISTVKKDEANKNMKYGKDDFTTEQFSRYVSNFEFSINTRNNN